MCNKRFHSFSSRISSLKRRLLPSYGAQVGAVLLAGIIFGLGAYLVYVSKAYSYLSDDPTMQRGNTRLIRWSQRATIAMYPTITS